MADKIISRDLTKRRIPCETENCDGQASIHTYRKTRFSDLGNGPGGDRSFLDLRYGVYYCPKCGGHFTQKLPEGVYDRGHSHFTKRVHDKAVGRVIDNEESIVDTVRYMKHQYGTSIPPTTLRDWVRRERQKREE